MLEKIRNYFPYLLPLLLIFSRVVSDVTIVIISILFLYYSFKKIGWEWWEWRKEDEMKSKMRMRMKLLKEDIGGSGSVNKHYWRLKFHHLTYCIFHSKYFHPRQGMRAQHTIRRWTNCLYRHCCCFHQVVAEPACVDIC